jgi:DNA-binding winged helix-turn-helix (wHTH) protein/Flp pilus assembly protein TadD
MSARRYLQFDGFRLDRHARSLHGPDGMPIPLKSKPFDVLLYLVEHADRVVTKNELLAAVWAGRVVEDNNLAQAITAVRRALSRPDAARAYITTVPGRGYCFTADVEVDTAAYSELATSAAEHAYLAGRYLMHVPSVDGLRRAIGYFRQALFHDPTLAPAWAGQAFAWRALAITGDVDPQQAFPLAIAAVDKALALDAELADAHSSRGFNQFWYDWDWGLAEASFARAIAADPRLPEARLGYAHLLANLGRFDECFAQVDRARELEPLSPLINALGAGFLQWGGRSDDAIRRVERALEVAPDFWIALNMRGTIRLETGDAAAAVADFERAGELSDGSTQALSLLGIAYVQSGQRARAVALLERLEARARDGYLPATALATLRNALGDEDAALDLLDRAHAERDLRITFLKVDRRWDNLRQHARFRALACQMQLD